MKILLAVSCAAWALSAAVPAHATDVGVSVQISQPGVFGRIDIGRFPQPQVVVAQPVIIQRPVQVQASEPVYLWVPPGHRQNWRRYCGQYNACGVPVYFVRHDWYDNNVRGRGEGRGDGQGDGKHGDKRKDKHHDKRDERGQGHGKRD